MGMERTQAMKNLLIYTSFAAALAISAQAHAWSGSDNESGAMVEIEQGNLVRSGNDIEVYDYDKGEYRDMTVESVTRFGNTVEVEVTDSATGETTTLEMDDN